MGYSQGRHQKCLRKWECKPTKAAFKRILNPLHTRNIPHIAERCSVLGDPNICQRVDSTMLTQAAFFEFKEYQNLSTCRTKQGNTDTHLESLSPSLFWDHVKLPIYHPNYIQWAMSSSASLKEQFRNQFCQQTQQENEASKTAIYLSPAVHELILLRIPKAVNKQNSWCIKWDGAFRLV